MPCKLEFPHELNYDTDHHLGARAMHVPHLLDPSRKGMRNNQKLGTTPTLQLVGLWIFEILRGRMENFANAPPIFIFATPPPHIFPVDPFYPIFCLHSTPFRTSNLRVFHLQS